MPSETMEQESIDWKEWETKGKNSLLKNVKAALDRCGFAVIDKKGRKSTLPKMIYQLIWQGLYGPLTPDNVAEMTISLSELNDEIPSLIMDIITVFDTEMDSQEFLTPERNRLLRILVLLDEKWCPELARERMDFETLNEFNRNIKAFHSKFIKLKTRLYYKQNKFNLFREENEGYCKLVMQLNPTNGQSDPEEILSNIRSLIGCFSLDPTRVIDIILDNFQMRPNEVEFFIPILRKYMPEVNLLAEVIGFRLLTFHENGVTPRSLHVIIGIMLHFNVIFIDDIYPWLLPDDEEISKEVEQMVADEKSTKKSVVQPKTKEEFENNQKLSLCQVLISLGSWKTFEAMLNYIPKPYLLERPQIATAICKFIHYLIAPVYATHSGFSDKIEPAPLEFVPTAVTDKQPQTFAEITETVFPILFVLGPSLRYDLVLVFKLTRITATALNKILKNHDTENNKTFEQITLLIQDCLFPTLSNIQANCCVSEAIWNVVKLYPLQARYSMYYHWREYLQTNHVMLAKRCQGKVNAKSCMKRVSKENVKQIGRLLGKLSHYSPATLFDCILFQIQMYDNLIGPVVDSLKYMTNMSYDVLGFCIFDSLYNDTKQRLKHDGTSVLPWFQSTSLFCATVFKKYNIDLSGILLYIMEQLKNNRSVELLILKEILQKMTGIDITDDMTQHQIDALSGGELLRSEAGYFVQQQNFKKTATRLKEALVENNLVAPLGIMLAQQRNYILFSESKNSHLKFIGKLYDECHDTLLQYGAFINGPIMYDAHSSFPSLHELLIEYKLDLDAAFYLSRSVLHSQAAGKSSDSKKSTKKIANITDAFFDIIDSTSTSIEELYPSKQWEDISAKFVAMFWSLSLNDISVPVAAYQKEIAKQKEQEQSLVKPNKSESKANSFADKLNQELKDQQQYVRSFLDHLKKRKNDWFLSRSTKPAKNEMITQFLQMCIFPRCILSITDALFCAQFIHTLHTIRTGNFSTLLCYDRLFCDITFSVMSCTENEASRYGRFLCAVLQNIMRWHSSKEIYDKECANTPGFVTKFRVSNEFSETNENVHFENYRHVCHKWHYKITKSLLTLLESGEYVQIRNGLIVLIKLLPTFPIIGKLAQFIEKRINKVKEEEKNNRQDLYTLSLSYSGLLLSRSQQWLNESDFHHVTPTASSTSSSSNETSNSLREDKLDIDTESFGNELPTDIYLSPPSYSQSSPPSSPVYSASSPSYPREASPAKEKTEKSDKHESSSSSHDKSEKAPLVIYRDILNSRSSSERFPERTISPESHEYFPREESRMYETFEDDNISYDSVDSDRLEEGELNRRRETPRRRRKSRIDEKDRRKVAKPRIRSRSGRL